MTRRAGTYSLLGFPLPCGLKCSLEPSRSHWGGDSWKFSCGCRLLSCPYPCPSRRINRKQEAYFFFFFYVLCKIDIFKSPVTMVTFCFLNWEEKKMVMTAFEGSQTSSEYLQKWVVTEIIPYFPNLKKMMLVQCMCMCEWVCGTRVYIYV